MDNPDEDSYSSQNTPVNWQQKGVSDIIGDGCEPLGWDIG